MKFAAHDAALMQQPWWVPLQRAEATAGASVQDLQPQPC